MVWWVWVGGGVRLLWGGVHLVCMFPSVGVLAAVGVGVVAPLFQSEKLVRIGTCIGA